MISFVCNICGEPQETEPQLLDRELPSCTSCGSNVRFRSIVHLLSLELFGVSLPLAEIPRIPEIAGVGLSDWSGYAAPLAEKFSYVNTHYDREPRLDVTHIPPEHRERYDFVIATEVFEHVPAPVERSLAEVRTLLKPGGFLLLTVPYTLDAKTAEHFPGLHRYALAEVDGETVLVNRRADGALEVFGDLVFHGGSGSTLELRQFGKTDLEDSLRAAGFADVRIFAESHLPFGIAHHKEWSLPIVARPRPGAAPAPWLTRLLRDHARLHKELEQRGAWAAELEAELEEARRRHAELHREFEERSRWAMAVDEEIGRARARIQSLEAALERLEGAPAVRVSRRLGLLPDREG